MGVDAYVAVKVDVVAKVKVHVKDDGRVAIVPGMGRHVFMQPTQKICHDPGG